MFAASRVSTGLDADKGLDADNKTLEDAGARAIRRGTCVWRANRAADVIALEAKAAKVSSRLNCGKNDVTHGHSQLLDFLRTAIVRPANMNPSTVRSSAMELDSGTVLGVTATAKSDVRLAAGPTSEPPLLGSPL